MLCVADLLQRLMLRQLYPYANSDDTKVYGFCRPLTISDVQQRVSACVDGVAAWMKANRLQLNHSKTEIFWCSSQRREYQIRTESILIGDALIPPLNSVRDLGIYIDADITVKAHVFVVFRTCFAALLHLRSIRRSLPPHAIKTLIHALVTSRIDYCSSVLAGVPGTQLRRLQSAVNAAARLIFSARKNEHLTPFFREFCSNFRRESSSGYVFWRIGAFMAPHHLTWLRTFTWLLMPTAVAVSAPLPP
jgi:hypothetical protein